MRCPLVSFEQDIEAGRQADGHVYTADQVHLVEGGRLPVDRRRRCHHGQWKRRRGGGRRCGDGIEILCDGGNENEAGRMSRCWFQNVPGVC